MKYQPPSLSAKLKEEEEEEEEERGGGGGEKEEEEKEEEEEEDISPLLKLRIPSLQSGQEKLIGFVFEMVLLYFL